jgi:NAD(P)-dependent dehydrogenase (short-subunit alcohol dehydrogenase family)
MYMTIPDVSGRSIADLISLTGRNAVVTGGARGIGLAICERLAEAGANIMVADLREGDGARAAAHLTQEWGVTTAFCTADVTDGVSIVRLADAAVQALGSIDIWVNNAGMYPEDPVLDTSDEQWDAVLAVNLRSTFLGSREAARRMVDAGRGGVILNIASTAAFQGEAGKAHYVAAKHGVRGLTKSLAIELGPHNIRVLAIAPMLTVTPGVVESGRDLGAVALPVLGRFGVPDDVARVALLCASDLAMFMTGSTVAVDGGTLTV